MRLSTKYVLHYDGDRAASEALRQATYLHLAGYFSASLEVVQALVTPGPWRVRGAYLLAQVEERLEMYSWDSEVGCPVLSKARARSSEEMHRHAQTRTCDRLFLWAAGTRSQDGPAGTHWGEAWFDSLVTRVADRENGPAALRRFLEDMKWILKDRADRRLQWPIPVWADDLVTLRPDPTDVEFTESELLPAAHAADKHIQIANHTRAYSCVELATVLDQILSGAKFKGGDLGTACWMYLVALALSEDDHTEARRCVTLALRHGVQVEDIEGGLRYWRPYRDFLKGGGLAPVLRLTNRKVDAYLTAFRSRNASSIVPASLGLPKHVGPITPLLDALLEAYERRGCKVSASLSPGLSRQQIIRRTSHLKFALPEPLIEVYMWRNGHADTLPDRRARFDFRDHHFLNLERSLAEYDEILHYWSSASDKVHLEECLPIAALEGSYLVVACGPHRLRTDEPHPIVYVGEGIDLYFHSLAAMLRTCVEWVSHRRWTKREHLASDEATEMDIWKKHNPGVFQE